MNLLQMKNFRFEIYESNKIKLIIYNYLTIRFLYSSREVLFPLLLPQMKLAHPSYIVQKNSIPFFTLPANRNLWCELILFDLSNINRKSLKTYCVDLWAFLLKFETYKICRENIVCYFPSGHPRREILLIPELLEPSSEQRRNVYF